MKELIKKLIGIPSASGAEESLATFIKGEIGPFVDHISSDTLGNLIAVKKSGRENAKKLAFSAHMDCNGFIATFIDDKGYIRVSNLGSPDYTSVAFTPVTLSGGVKGVLVPEENVTGKDLKPSKLYVDIGAKSKEEAEKNVCVGDFIFIDSFYTELLNDRIAARGLDDKIGCAILIECAKKQLPCEYDVYYVFSVQEELGIRGAKTAAGGILPDFAVAVDVTDTGDTIGGPHMAVSLGKGAAIKIKDSSVICSPKIVSALKNAAESAKIPYQTEILEGGGTDTSAFQSIGSGAASGCISVPTKFIHTGVELCDLNDASSCLALAAELILRGNI